MENVSFDPYLFLRTPALSYKDYDMDMMEQILRSDFFQSAIFFASESLYRELSRHAFDYKLLDAKVKLSLQKYFNRMCFRPTPFGMFSAFTSVKWNSVNCSAPIILEDDKRIYINPDFQFTVDVAKRMQKCGEFKNLRYYANNSIYTLNGEKRYLTNSIAADHKKTDFLIISYKTDRLMNKLMRFCKDGKTIDELTTWLEEITGDASEIRAYIDDMIAAGLLIPETYPNMSGEKYFNRLLKIAREAPFTNEIADDVMSYEAIMNSITNESSIHIEKLTGSRLCRSSERNLSSMFYVGYERRSASGLNGALRDNIKDGLYCLNKLAFDSSPKSISTFKTKFRARFEDQEIPLLQALDRETGIGYEGLEANLVTSELLDGIQLDLHSNSLNFNWTPVHELFLSKLTGGKEHGCITIGEKDMQRLNGASELKTPPSFSVIFRPYGDKVWIEQAGGCTATALLGRFTLFSDEVLRNVKDIAAAEENKNPDVVFAEISCFNDEHAANINSNAGIRSYEIPIGVYSALGHDHIVSLQDIFISVNNNTIVLRSKKLNKIIIPRLSSAYNYSRSELSIFRFLCDLQYQGLKFNYTFDFKSLLPGLNFYPRVEYKQCILFPATWVLNADEIVEICEAGSFENFNKIAGKFRLNKQFALTEGDNQLVFNRDDPDSVKMLMKVIRNKASVTFQEIFIEQCASINDHTGKPYAGQLIASVFSNQVTYSQRSLMPVTVKKNKVKRIYLPCDEWVYLKLYCHPSVSNSILVKNVKSIIANLKKQDILKTWYFIRYADPDQHLRVRIQVKQNEASAVIKCFEKNIRHHVESGSVNNFLLDTYKRELERYGADTIEYVERIFQSSSELIINYLKNIPYGGRYSELHLAIISVDSMLDIFFHHNGDRINLLKSMHQGMKHEFEDSKQLKFQLDNKYRDYSGFINGMDGNKSMIMDIAGKKEFAAFLQAPRSLNESTQWLVPGKLFNLVSDLIHMHLNRMFNDKQRSHEFIIYYLLYKYYSSVEARKEKHILSAAASKGFSIDQVKEAVLK